MSWFRRIPHLKTPPKHPVPHHTSPATDRALQKAKETSPKQATPPAK